MSKLTILELPFLSVYTDTVGLALVVDIFDLVVVDRLCI